MTSYFCDWLWDSLTVLCDGNVTCGLDDPWSIRSLGNANEQSIHEIFNGPRVLELRHKLLVGVQCEPCRLFAELDDDTIARIRPPSLFPKRLVVEPTISCNLRCNNLSCEVANDKRAKIRRSLFLDWSLFCNIIDELAPHLEGLYFFNYGEPFLHPRALDMLAYARDKATKAKIVTTTNGQLLDNKETVTRIVSEGLLDWICFTICGTDNHTYQKYHNGGHVDKALDAMRMFVTERTQRAKKSPEIFWRYILFNWNDSDDQIGQVKKLAKEIGVDGFSFMLSTLPGTRSSLRAPGQSGYSAIEDHVEREYHYDNDVYADVGLYRPEACNVSGEYCWTSRKAKVHVIVENGVGKLLLCRTGHKEMIATNVYIETPYEKRTVKISDSFWQEVKFIMPDAFDGMSFPATIETEKLFVPFLEGVNNDIRELGVRISLATILKPDG